MSKFRSLVEEITNQPEVTYKYLTPEIRKELKAWFEIIAENFDIEELDSYRYIPATYWEPSGCSYDEIDFEKAIIAEVNDRIDEFEEDEIMLKFMTEEELNNNRDAIDDEIMKYVEQCYNDYTSGKYKDHITYC